MMIFHLQRLLNSNEAGVKMNPKHFYFKKIILFIFIGIFNHATPSHGDDPASLVLAAGVKGQQYYKFSVLLAEQLNRNMNAGLKVSVIPTQGSVEGLNLIAKNKADFAVVQSDVAYYAYNGKNFFQTNRSFKLVAPLFWEHVWIISKKRVEY